MKDDINAIQERAVSYIFESFKKKINPICALDMGLGKTRVACNIIKNTISAYNSYRILIVIKTSNYIDPWIKELLDTHCINKHPRGNPRSIKLKGLRRKKGNDPSVMKFANCIYMQGKDRFDYFQSNSEVYRMPSNNIYIAPYDTLRIDIEKNRYDNSLYYDLIVFDELQLIMNTQKETKNLTALSELKARKKLALSGTPGQNTSLEIGLMYIFLNDQPQLEKYLSLPDNISEDDADENDEKEDQIKKEKENILLKGKTDCEKNNALFYYSVEKSHFDKTAFILSLPVDPKHYELAQKHYGKNNKKLFQKKLMYLSSPSSVYYYNYKDVGHPYCTKEKAVEIILRHMGNGEKAVVFSRFLDVLDSYYDLCQKIGLPAVIITGKDKGGTLQDKLKLFENSRHFNVLLTTLQKSSEGLNIDYANHVIILEFWWNPQKIIQAMSRIDRLSQRYQDIYIYLLCYNRTIETKKEKDGTIEIKGILKEEKVFLTKMKDKISDINEFFEEIYNENRRYYPDSLSLRELPPKKEFYNIDTVEEELDEFLTQRHKKINIPEQEFSEINNITYNQTVNFTQSYIKSYRYVSNLLLQYPWRFWNQNIQGYLNSYYSQILNGDKGIEIKNRIDKQLKYSMPKITLYDSFYPFLFIKHRTFTTNIRDIQTGQYIPTSFEILFALGKRENGLYHVLSPQYFPINTKKELMEYMLEKNITGVSTIIIDSVEYINEKQPQDNLLGTKDFSLNSFPKLVEQIPPHPPVAAPMGEVLNQSGLHPNKSANFTDKPEFILSLTSIFFETVIYVHRNLDKNLINIETIFSQPTIEDALKLANRLRYEANDSKTIVMYKHIKNKLKYTTPLFLYPLNIRSIIGTNNIIDILCILISIILNYKNFDSIKEAEKYITIATNEILEYGRELIPNWDIIIKPINAISGRKHSYKKELPNQKINKYIPEGTGIGSEVDMDEMLDAKN